MSLGEKLPEFHRCAAGEARPGRLMVAGMVSLFVGGSYWYISSLSHAEGRSLYGLAFWTQAAILLVYGTVRTTGSVHAERVEKTWDLQRLTPLSAWEIALGKLLGAPVFPFFLAATFIPWTLLGFLGSKELSWPAFLWHQAGLLCTAFLSLSLGLLGSTYSEERNVGTSSPTAGGSVVGLLALWILGVVVETTARPNPGFPEPVAFFGIPMSLPSLVCLSSLLFGGWALAASAWRVGRELLEPRRLWRVPVFLAFLFAYELGFRGSNPALCVPVPAFVAFFISVLNQERLEHWRAWLPLEGPVDWARLPSWILASATFTLIAVAASALSLASGTGGSDVLWRYPLLQAFFLTRDLAFVQLCRFSDSRRPEIMALVLIGLAYLLPAAMLAAAQRPHALHLVMPLADSQVQAFWNLAPAFLEAAAMVCVLWSSIPEKRAPRQ